MTRCLCRIAPLLWIVLAACGRGEEASMQDFTLTVTPAGTPAAGAPIALTLEVRDPDGRRVTDLEITHEKLLHLIVVSADLSFFTHEHPMRQPDGRLAVELTLPRPGEYRAFADLKPKGGEPVVVSAPLVVPGPPAPAVALSPVALPAVARDGGYELELRPDAPLTAGRDAMLSFAIRDASGPVTDLRPYLGARGHCVIISADRAHYLHSHPLDGDGATVAFHTAFPTAGRYKIWVELRPRGEPLRVAFTVDVAAASATAPSAASGAHHHER
jgi:hypothetical protein